MRDTAELSTAPGQALKPSQKLRVLMATGPGCWLNLSPVFAAALLAEVAALERRDISPDRVRAEPRDSCTDAGGGSGLVRVGHVSGGNISMSARGISPAESFGGGAVRRCFPVGHVEFGVVVHTTYGITFGLRTTEGPADRRDLFSGHVTADMPAQLRALADHLERLGVAG